MALANDSPQTGKGAFNLGIAESCAFDARGRPHTLNGGDPPQAGQLFRGERLDDRPATLKLVDFRDELKYCRRDCDVLDSLPYYPFSPNYSRFVALPFLPFSLAFRALFDSIRPSMHSRQIGS